MDFEIITTERLRLRKISPEVHDYIFGNYADDQIMQFLGMDSVDALRIEEDKYAKGLSTFNRSYLYFQLIDLASEKIIGWCGYHTWYLEHRRAEIGYGLTDNEFKGIGIMTEAIIPIIDYGFEKMNLNRIEAFIGPGNIPSIKLISKFNFIKEGQLRSHYLKNNKMEDSIVFSLLKSE